MTRNHLTLVLLALSMLGSGRMAAQDAPAAPAAAPAKAESAASSPAKTVPAYESDPKYIAALAEAKQLKRARQYSFAEDLFRKANKIAGGQSRVCLDELFQLQMGMGHAKDAVATATQLVAVATTPLDKSLAEGRVGQALLQQGGEKPKPALLEAAHTSLQAALTDYPRNNAARWSDACVLERMGRSDDASKAFSECAKIAGPKDPMRLRAMHFADDPSLSLHKMAPAFEVTALDGTRFNLDGMTGRVVLVDFWATWCGPCNEELPNVKKMVKDFTGEPFTLISVSWDDDEAKWKDFIAKNGMTWLQYRDAGHKLSEQFGVNAIPHYFTIDSDGVLTAEVLGSGNDVEGKIRKLLKKAHEAQVQKIAVSGAAAEPVPAGTR